ncbi:hypothetical protein DL765_004819 [Monosporascus sp. GIB2]|nr:hypothetical protein DL765_004819 [Monosporascus sp. GIB2]
MAASRAVLSQRGKHVIDATYERKKTPPAHRYLLKSIAGGAPRLHPHGSPCTDYFRRHDVVDLYDRLRRGSEVPRQGRQRARSEGFSQAPGRYPVWQRGAVPGHLGEPDDKYFKEYVGQSGDVDMRLIRREAVLPSTGNKTSLRTLTMPEAVAEHRGDVPSPGPAVPTGTHLRDWMDPRGVKQPHGGVNAAPPLDRGIVARWGPQVGHGHRGSARVGDSIGMLAPEVSLIRAAAAIVRGWRTEI